MTYSGVEIHKKRKKNMATLRHFCHKSKRRKIAPFAQGLSIHFEKSLCSLHSTILCLWASSYILALAGMAMAAQQLKLQQEITCRYRPRANKKYYLKK
jgi:hypothetical protein